MSLYSDLQRKKVKEMEVLHVMDWALCKVKQY